MVSEPVRDFDPSSTPGRIRVMIGDVNPGAAGFTFTDAELTQFYADASSEYNGAAALALMAWAARLAGEWDSVSADAFSRSMVNPSDEKRKMAEMYANLSATVDVDDKPVAFGRARIDWRSETTWKNIRDREFAEDEESG